MTGGYCRRSLPSGEPCPEPATVAWQDEDPTVCARHADEQESAAVLRSLVEHGPGVPLTLLPDGH